jgi:hypothetical protein
MECVALDTSNQNSAPALIYVYFNVYFLFMSSHIGVKYDNNVVLYRLQIFHISLLKSVDK